MQISRKYFLSAFNKMLMVVFGLITLSPLACAQDTPSRQFSKESGRVVNVILENMNADQYSAALTKLNEVIELPALNPYEKSVIHQMRGQALYELKRNEEAIQAFEDAITAGGLLPNEAKQIRLNIAQLHIGEGNHVVGAEMIEQWERDGNQLKPNHVELLVQAWVSADEYGRALPWAEKWFEAADPKERKHFDLLNFLYNNLGLSVRQSILVDEMKKQWPDEFSQK